MKLIKLFSLAAVAATAAIAFVGAPSASASSTALCTIQVLPCPSGNQYQGTVLGLAQSTSKTPLLLHTNIWDIECSDSHISLSTLSGLTPGALTASVTVLTWSNCRREDNESACEVKTTKKGSLLTLHTGANKGTIQSHGTEVLLNCGGLHCVFGGLPVLDAVGGSTLAGATNGTVTANDQMEEVSGFLCPDIATWLATYELVSPAHLYISS